MDDNGSDCTGDERDMARCFADGVIAALFNLEHKLRNFRSRLNLEFAEMNPSLCHSRCVRVAVIRWVGESAEA